MNVTWFLRRPDVTEVFWATLYVPAGWGWLVAVYTKIRHRQDWGHQLRARCKSRCISDRRVPALSMQPTVMEGDRIFADAKYYETRAPKRGDFVVARKQRTVVKRVFDPTQARPANSRFSVDTFTFSPSLMKSGTRISRPVSSLADLVTLPLDESPRTPGSV